MTKFKPSTQVDFVIVGAGAAGGVMAKELSTAGFQVVVLEQGPYLRESDFTYDEKRVRDTPQLVNDHALQPNTFRKTEQEKAVLAPAISYGRCVGGGTVHYTATHWRFREIDFIERSKLGPISGTGLDDWPITYADLEPYYTKAEWDMGYSGLRGGSPFESSRSKDYPLPPFPNKSSGVLLDRAAAKLGLHTSPIPVAILSQPYKGRQGCVHCGFCEWFGCKVGAKSSSLAALFPVAEKTGRCEIRPNSYVREVSVDKSGRVNGVVYFDAQKKEVMQKAKAVVVCANGTETPRLLLMSKSSQFPNGLANSSGVVGKYLMFGTGASAHGLFEHPLNEYKSIQATRSIEDFYDSDPKRGFYGGGRIDARYGFSGPIGFALGGLPPDVPRWGAEFKKACKDANQTLTLQVFATSLPLETNNITLDPDVKDAWGLPAMRVTYRDHPDGMKTKEFFRAKALEILDAAGATKKWAGPVGETRNGGHLMGSCRMGNDPKTSVIDKFNRAHDVPNLFIVDGSSFVTSGRNHPTCTIEALAYRAADNAINMAKKGSLKAPVS
ncbi:MAG TPA: GMC family oxidoreductase [Bryobacteraceae bacterium]|nr:GMC family oxidoreductase [Bryobacteraceae bacterium]